MLYKFTFQSCEDGIHVLHTIIASQAIKERMIVTGLSLWT